MDSGIESVAEVDNADKQLVKSIKSLLCEIRRPFPESGIEKISYTVYLTDPKTEEYTKQYNEQILSRLDPLKVYIKLDGSILLCWEKAGKFCHRQIVADWLEQATGFRITEVKT